MNLKNTTRDGLLDFVERQLSFFTPDGKPTRAVLNDHVDEALARLRICINAVKAWRHDEFDYLHSSQYATFLYFLSNTIWKASKSTEVPIKLFLLNKALNGIDCFYEINMPDIFFIGHSVGIVLANTQYANYLVLYQNCTVGKNHGAAPVLEERVLLYPGTSVIGRTRVRAGSVLSLGVRVVNQDTPGESLVFQGEGGELIFKPAGHDIFADVFRF